MVAYYIINVLYSFERGSELEYKSGLCRRCGTERGFLATGSALGSISSLTSVFLSVFFSRKQPISRDTSLHSLSTASPLQAARFLWLLNAWLVYHGFLSSTWSLRDFSSAFSCFLFLFFRLVFRLPKCLEVLAVDFTDFLYAGLASLPVIPGPRRQK